MKRILLLVLSLIIAQSSPADASWKDILSEMEGSVKDLRNPETLNERLFKPSTQSDGQLSSMDGSVKFDGSFLCQDEIDILEVSAAKAKNGEMNITLAYDLVGGNKKTLVIKNVAGACSGAVVYDCQPSGSWKGCKYGVLEFTKSQLVVSPNLPSGEPRPAVGLQGCFCFSDVCGGTADVYMPQILSHIGQAVADQIAATRRDILVTGPEYVASTKAKWTSGDPANCDNSTISMLTDQAGKLEFSYQDTINSQGDGSAWDLVTKQLERTTTQFTCEQKAKVSSEWGEVTRVQKTTWGVGWDTDGASTQCFWFMTEPKKSCGYYFGEPNSWTRCLEQAERGRAGVCSDLWVNSGFFTSITDVRNAKPVTGKMGLCNWGISCYGAEGCGDDGQIWEMDCVGLKFADRFVCYSSSKVEEGETVLNSPFDPTKYDGCDEVRHVETTCQDLERRKDCRLLREETDGVLTVSNGVVTTARPQTSCKTIKGVAETRVVCEPWWSKRRTYECEDQTDDWEKEKQRAEHVGGNIQMDSKKYVSSVGDLTFKDGVVTQQVIDLNLQFDNSYRTCVPACVVQREVDNYEPIVPNAQGKLGADGNWHVEDQEPSIVPTGKRTIIDTVECELLENKYTCPIPNGWQMRAQCACTDGDEFLNVISSLTVLNEVSKDFICSTGTEMGVCASDDEEHLQNVICGKFSPTSETLVEGADYWSCVPKLWVGKTISNQAHTTEINDMFECLAGPTVLKNEVNLGVVTSQKTWWASSLDWALKEALGYVNTNLKDKIGYQCGCAGPANEINVCQGVENGQFVCLVNNQLFQTEAQCSKSCVGFATYSTKDGLCVWSSRGDQIFQRGDFRVDYNLGLNYLDRHFGEAFVEFSPFDETLVSKGLGECKLKSGKYECQTDGKVYNTDALCSKSCLIPSNKIDGCKERITDGQLTNTSVQGVCETQNGGSVINRHAYEKQSNILMGIWLWPLGWLPHDGVTFFPDGWPDYGTGIPINNIWLTEETKSETGWVDFMVGYEGWEGWDGEAYLYPAYGWLKHKDGRIIKSYPAEVYRRATRGTGTVAKGEWLFPDGTIVKKETRITRDGGYCAGAMFGCGNWEDVTEIIGAGYVCSSDGQAYTSEAQCLQGCKRDATICSATGAEVSSQAECQVSDFVCASNGKSFDTQSQCVKSCPIENLIDHKSCLTTSDPVRFSLYHSAKKSSQFGFDINLDFVKGTSYQRVTSKDWGDEALILNQCLEKYIAPFLKVTEPGTGAHFEFSELDVLAYQVAGEKKELPYLKGELPEYPLVYVGKNTIVSSGVPPGYLEEVDEDGNLVLVLDPDYDPHSVVEQPQGSNIPRKPMFLVKKVGSPSHAKSQSRAGIYSFQVSNLTAYAYHYQCPEGQITNSKTCGQIPPFGGVYDTIAGQQCIQYACDAAEIENNSNQYSGCGLVNDGLVK